ncbi:MAG: UDP-N-acetylglucosamine--N-acetylmuramyl-(pentapeptide) pyrophosphoryl-undecaprenol N-acetylglucosamine transferase [Dehalococcoidia bacterium]
MRIAITGGGTGGHLYPGFSVAEALATLPGGPFDIRFFGPDDRGERELVDARGIPFERVPAAAIRGRGPLSLAKNVLRLAWGTVTAVRRLRAFKPAAIFSTGGYGSFPCSVAAKVLRLPLVVYLPDVAPGWAVKAEQRLATRMATTTDAALRFLPASKTRVTGYPVRATFFSETRASARAKLAIAPDARVVLVAGASQGATAINRAIWAGLPALRAAGIDVWHITGSAGIAEAEKAATANPAYHPAAFRDDLPLLMVAANLGVFRAGASVLGEIPASGIPAVLIPGTFAGAHQRDNAQWLVDAGAAEIVEESAIEGLAPRLTALLGEPARLARMEEAARSLARPNAARDIANLLLEVAKR